MELLSFLSKEDFMKKYAQSESTYVRRIDELKDHSEFKRAYVRPTNQEVWIIEEIYQQFLIWKSDNLFK